ncbi:MAG: hypothetical protein HY399_03050, partial [Elusimicrobia bacterium]|nr:hypothetical protein [Elusimicrobiota bacterium]
VLTPLATYFMLKPSGEGGLGKGFGSREGAFNEAGAPYETGTGGFAPGAPVGQSGEVITPLSARDPSSLVMAPGGPQQPQPDVKDALGQALKASAGEATSRAGLPVPKPALQGALRGLGALTGGASPASSPISGKDVLASAAGAPGRAAVKSFAGPNALPDYVGVGQTSPSSTNKGALEQLRSQADQAASRMPQQGAAAGLEQAAKDSIQASGTGSGSGGPAKGDADKNPAGSSTKDTKNIGESLDFIRRKMIMEKTLSEAFERRKMLFEKGCGWTAHRWDDKKSFEDNTKGSYSQLAVTGDLLCGAFRDEGIKKIGGGAADYFFSDPDKKYFCSENPLREIVKCRPEDGMYWIKDPDGKLSPGTGKCTCIIDKTRGGPLHFANIMKYMGAPLKLIPHAPKGEGLGGGNYGEKVEAAKSAIAVAVKAINEAISPTSLQGKTVGEAIQEWNKSTDPAKPDMVAALSDYSAAMRMLSDSIGLSSEAQKKAKELEGTEELKGTRLGIAKEVEMQIDNNLSKIYSEDKPAFEQATRSKDVKTMTEIKARALTRAMEVNRRIGNEDQSVRKWMKDAYLDAQFIRGKTNAAVDKVDGKDGAAKTLERIKPQNVMAKGIMDDVVTRAKDAVEKTRQAANEAVGLAEGAEGFVTNSSYFGGVDREGKDVGVYDSKLGSAVKDVLTVVGGQNPSTWVLLIDQVESPSSSVDAASIEKESDALFASSEQKAKEVRVVAHQILENARRQSPLTVAQEAKK